MHSIVCESIQRPLTGVKVPTVQLSLIESVNDSPAIHITVPPSMVPPAGCTDVALASTSYNNLTACERSIDAGTSGVKYSPGAPPLLSILISALDTS